MYDEPVKDDELQLPPNMRDDRPRPPCAARLEELAKPKKRLLSFVWETYAYLFTPERREAVRFLLQELYSMTPEETAQYFDVLSSVMKKMEARERMKKRLAKRCQEKIKKAQRKRAFKKFEMLLRTAMKNANEHPVPPLVSPRLRNISDVILQQLCEILGITVPDRTDINEQAQFVMNVADWFAIGVEHIYYEIQVQKNREFNAIEEELIRAKAEELDENEIKPKSAKRQSHNDE